MIDRLSHLLKTERTQARNFSPVARQALEAVNYAFYSIDSMLVATNPQQLTIPETFNQPFARQLRLCKKYQDQLQQNLKTKAIRLIVVNPDMIRQLDGQYQHQTDQPLLHNFFVRTSQKGVIVGRRQPTDQLCATWADQRWPFPDVGLLLLIVPAQTHQSNLFKR